MRVVSDNTQEEITAARLQDVLERAARRLTANLLRIAAGAGSPHDVYSQAVDLVATIESLRESSAFPHPPWTPIVTALQDRDWRRGNPGYPDYNRTSAAQERRWEANGERAMERARDSAVQASLRLVAAQLLAQPTQESTSRSDFSAAMMDHEKARAQRIQARDR